MTFGYSALLVLTTALLTTIFSFWRFHGEKWWELKVKTYSNIMESLHHIKKSDEVAYEDYYIRTGLEELDDEIISRQPMELDALKEIYQQAKLSKEEIEKIIDTSSFIIKPAVVIELEKLLAEYKTSFHIDEYDNILEKDVKLINCCLERVRVIAQRDLQSMPEFLINSIAIQAKRIYKLFYKK